MLWLLLNNIYKGDCIDLMKQLPENYIDLTVTSPPYDDLRKYNGYTFNFEETANELYRITKKGGVVVWVVGDKTIKGSETGTSFKQALYFKEIGFNLHDTMIYHKNNPTPMRANRYQQCFEYMFVFSKGKPKTFNPIMTEKKYIENRKVKHYNKNQNGEQISHEYKSTSDMKVINNIWTYNVGLHHSSKDRIAFKHPAVFPEQLAEDHIVSWTNEGDLVFDPFAGSGTTLKMAMLNNRKFLGFEISDEYVELSKQRLQDHAKDGYCYCGGELTWQNDFDEGHFYRCHNCDNEVLKELGV